MPGPVRLPAAGRLLPAVSCPDEADDGQGVSPTAAPDGRSGRSRGGGAPRLEIRSPPGMAVLPRSICNRGSDGAAGRPRTFAAHAGHRLQRARVSPLCLDRRNENPVISTIPITMPHIAVVICAPRLHHAVLHTLRQGTARRFPVYPGHSASARETWRYAAGRCRPDPRTRGAISSARAPLRGFRPGFARAGARAGATPGRVLLTSSPGNFVKPGHGIARWRQGHRIAARRAARARDVRTAAGQRGFRHGNEESERSGGAASVARHARGGSVRVMRAEARSLRCRCRASVRGAHGSVDRRRPGAGA